MSEAQLRVVEESGSAGDAKQMELEEAVERAVEEGRLLLEMQEWRSVEEFNDDSEYSKMLHEAVQVRTLPLPAWPVGAGGRGQSCGEQIESPPLQ